MPFYRKMISWFLSPLVYFFIILIFNFFVMQLLLNFLVTFFGFSVQDDGWLMAYLEHIRQSLSLFFWFFYCLFISYSCYTNYISNSPKYNMSLTKNQKNVSKFLFLWLLLFTFWAWILLLASVLHESIPLFIKYLY